MKLITVYFKDSKNMTELDNSSVQLAVTSFSATAPHIMVPEEKKGMNTNALRADIKETFRGLSAFLLLTSDRAVRRRYENIVPEIERVLKPDGVFILNVGPPNISAEADVFGTDLNILYPYIIAEDILRLSSLKLRREYLSIFRFGNAKPKMERWFMFSKTQEWKEKEDVIIPFVIKSASTPIPWYYDDESGQHTMTATPFPTNILRLLIKRFSDEGDLILDPCSGTGTLGLVGGCMKRNVALYEIAINMQALLLKRLAPLGKNVNFVGRADSIGKAAQKLVPPL